MTAPESETPSEESEQATGQKTPADLAAAMLKNCVDNYVDRTKEWLDANREAFTGVFEKSLSGGYTLDKFVQDSAGMWAQTVKYLTDLASFGGDMPPGCGPEGERHA